MDGETPETLGYRGAQYVRADVVEGRVREEREACLDRLGRLSAWHSAKHQAAETLGLTSRASRYWQRVVALEDAANAIRTRPALASPSDSSGDDEGGKMNG